MSRNINEIAKEIRSSWAKVNYAAEPYLSAMFSLTTMNDKIGFDDAKSIILYFLSNAGSWRGEEAKRIKSELKTMIK